MKELSESDKAAIVNGVPKTNLVLFAPGLQGHGAMLIDRSTYANHGTITAPTWAHTPRGIYVPTTPSKPDFGAAASLNILNNLSVLTWLKTPAAWATGAQWSVTGTFGKWLAAGSLRAWLLSWTNPLSGNHDENTLGIQLGDPTTGNQIYQSYYSTPLSLLTWYHCGFTFASGTVVLYLNGASVAISVRGSQPTPPSTIMNNAATVAYPRETFPMLDPAGIPMIYSGSPVLTAAQMLQIYTRQRHLFGA